MADRSQPRLLPSPIVRRVRSRCITKIVEFEYTVPADAKRCVHTCPVCVSSLPSWLLEVQRIVLEATSLYKSRDRELHITWVLHNPDRFPLLSITVYIVVDDGWIR
jgi:hypothetical protein